MMPGKAVMQGGKRDEIIDAALKLFFERGYEATTVRMIQRAVGSEVSLFYYYFRNKDDLFDKVLDRFFSQYEADFARIVARGRRNPCRAMEDFFEYMEAETIKFRRQYAANMHRTIRWAIREHSLTLIEPHLREIVAIQSEYYGVRPALEPDVAALYLTHGVGSAILHADQDKYFDLRDEIKRGTSLIMAMPAEDQELRIPCPARPEDIPRWMDLLETVREDFPGLDRDAHRRILADRASRGEAWVIHNGRELAAAMVFSHERTELEFLAVRPDFRRRGLAGRLVETMAAGFPVGTVVTVTTFREDDPRGAAARGFYRRLGFDPGALVTLFGYPCQTLTLTVADGTPVPPHPPTSGRTHSTKEVPHGI